MVIDKFDMGGKICRIGACVLGLIGDEALLARFDCTVLLPRVGRRDHSNVGLSVSGDIVIDFVIRRDFFAHTLHRPSRNRNLP